MRLTKDAFSAIVLLVQTSRIFVAASSQIRCGRVEPSHLESITAPLRNAVSAFLHSTCRGIAANHSRIATWPQYANISADNRSLTLHVQGYAYALCGSGRQPRRQLLGELLGFTGYDVKFLDDHALLPADFLSDSVAGAKISLGTRDGWLAVDISTNEYGHFDGFHWKR